MTNLVVLIPVALFLGFIGLGAFLWALRSGQYEDLDGAAERILLDDSPPDVAGALKDAPQDRVRDLARRLR